MTLVEENIFEVLDLSSATNLPRGLNFVNPPAQILPPDDEIHNNYWKFFNQMENPILPNQRPQTHT